jgi:hypothetical protein
MKDTNDGIDLWSCEGELRHLIVSRRGLWQDKAWMYLGASASIRLLKSGKNPRGDRSLSSPTKVPGQGKRLYQGRDEALVFFATLLLRVPGRSSFSI